MKIGVALSGGGYRAAVYHLGTLKKLKELGILEQVNVVSSNSGGSITAACYSLMHKDFEAFYAHVINGAKQSVIHRAIRTPRIWIPIAAIISLLILALLVLSAPFPYPYIILPILIIVVASLIRYQFRLLPLSNIIEDVYAEVFFSNKTLSDFSEDFKTAILSTNLSTGRPFTFSREKMSDSTYDYEISPPIKFKHESFPIAKAVMASTNVPGVFTPVTIPIDYFKIEEDFSRVEPCLVDGGVYDNQGIHKLTWPTSSFYCDTVIVSDAGTELPSSSSFQNSISLLLRTGNVFMERIKNFQMLRSIFVKHVEGSPIVAYQSLSFDVEISVDKFIEMLQDNCISDLVIKTHNIDRKDMEKGNWNNIKESVMQNINYENILSFQCTEEELGVARSVSTNLTSLKEDEIQALIKHAMAITEIQVRLFCPHLIENHDIQ